MPGERGAECARRAVADPFGGLIEPEVVASQKISRDGRSPGQQVFHRGQADGPREALELEAFNVRVKLVEPGYGPTTRFTSNSGPRAATEQIPEAYAPFAERVLAAFAQPAAVTTEADVAEAVYRAATDDSGQLRFPAGSDALALSLAHRPGLASGVLSA